MATTYPLDTLAAKITAAGITAPSYDDLLASLQASFRQIHGADAYIDADSQDGQLLAIFAKAIHDCNQTAIAVYNSFSPATAQGVGLSNVVKINHMQRSVATNSQVNLTVTGTAGTAIVNGLAADDLGNKWALPPSVLIPPAGFVIITAVSVEAGAIPADIGTITKILTPTAGWQSVTNASAASLGEPVESDAQLRARQEISPALQAQTVMDGIVAAILALSGVTYVRAYENDTDATDSNGLPEHSIGIVVQGGDATEIATAIYNKKAPGVSTYGTTTISIPDISGALRDIKFSVPTQVPIKVAIDLEAGTNYTTIIGASMKQAIADYINNQLTIGDDVIVVRLNVPAMLNGDPASDTYKITSLEAGLVSGSVGTADITITFTSKATCSVSDITITVI